jgi:8-oxo-dGTP pyrophosphatase MutT (NUDIX family)
VTHPLDDGRPITGLDVTSREPIYAGEVVDLSVVHYRRPGGLVVRREVIAHPGAVVMVPVEQDHVLMVRQPREAVGEYLLELPAGKLDVPGEPPLECARRELAEEVGRAAGAWRDLGGFYTAPAILEEYIHCFLATDLSPVAHEPIPEEEIEVVPVPLVQLDELIAQVHDAKSLIGLLRLRGIVGRHGDAPGRAR